MSITLSSNSSSGIYCGGANGHIRIWAGGPEAKPKVCACGSYRFVEHHCTCGDIHERMVLIDPINEPIRREWDTPEEDAAWKDLLTDSPTIAPEESTTK